MNAILENHFYQASALFERSSFSEAEECIKAALAIEPENSKALHFYTQILLAQGRRPEALPMSEKALAAAEKHGGSLLGILYLLGSLQLEFGQIEEATQSAAKASAIDPSHQGTILLQANLLYRSGNRKDAKELASRAFDGPYRHMAHYLIGEIDFANCDFKSSAEQYEHVISFRPGFKEARISLGLCRSQLGERKAAEEQLEWLLQQDDNSDSDLNQAGNIRLYLGDYKEAIGLYTQAALIKPDSASAHSNTGLALHIQGKLEEAIGHYLYAVLCDPNHASSHLNLGTILLLLGDYNNGFTEYEWRRIAKPTPEIDSTTNIKEITSRSSLPETIIFNHEMGIGDCIQFMRYGKLLQEWGHETILLCPQQIIPLAESSKCFNSVSSNLELDLPPGRKCGWIPILNLPKVLGITREDPLINEPYLSAPPDRLKYWHSQLKRPGRLLIGLHWQGNPGAERTTLRGRSIPLSSLSPLAEIPTIDFVSLQKGPGAEQLATVPTPFRDRFVQCQQAVDDTWDFLETSAIAASCDLIISTDSGLAHLAGAIGLPLWLLLAFIPEWRWGLEGERTAWYPSAKLYRQTSLGDWPGVIEQVKQDLQALIASTPH